MSTDVYTCVTPSHSVSARMRVSQGVDVVSVCCLIAFVVIAGIAIVDQWPPRALDTTQIRRVQ